MKTKFKLLMATLVALGTMGAVAVFKAPEPASASTMVCWEDPNAVTYLNNYYWSFLNNGSLMATKNGCVGLQYFENGDAYTWQAHVQDIDEQGYWPYWSDDDGVTQLQYQTPGTTVWHDWIYDKNSADYTVSWGTQGPYSKIMNGMPSRWHWRIKETTHYACVDIPGQCGLYGSIQWTYDPRYNPSFTLGP